MTDRGMLTCALWVLMSLGACSAEPGSQEPLGELSAELAQSCAHDSECGAGKVCSPTHGCVSPAGCYVASGPGVVVGDVVIDDVDTWDDLQAVAGAWCITGNLTVKKAPLGALSQLEELVAVGNTISITDNAYLTSLRGFDNLRRALKLTVMRNQELRELTGAWRLSTLASVQVYANPWLSDLRGLDGLTALSWAEVVNNSNLTALWGLHNVTSVFGYLDIRQNPKLVDLRGLSSVGSIGNMLQVMDNPGLLELEGLSALTRIGNTLRVMRNSSLETSYALRGLTSARTFQVSDNPKLDACELAEQATRIGADCAGCARNGACGPRLSLTIDDVSDWNARNETAYGSIQPGDTLNVYVRVFNRSQNEAVLSPARVIVQNSAVSAAAVGAFSGPVAAGAERYALPWLRLANDAQRGQVLTAQIEVDWSAAGQTGTLSRSREIAIEADSSAYGDVYLGLRTIGDDLPVNGAGALDGRFLPGERLRTLLAVQNRIRSPLTILALRLVHQGSPVFVDFDPAHAWHETVAPADTLFLTPTFAIASDAAAGGHVVHYELDYEQNGQQHTVSSAFFWPVVTLP